MCDHGILPWQDINDLKAGVTEDTIKEVLQDTKTACAVMLVTRDVEKSGMIRMVEAPFIFKRVINKDQFFVLPVAVGIDYGDLDEVLGPAKGVVRADSTNVLKSDSPVDEAFATDIAREVLRNRLLEVHQELKPDEPVKIRIATFSPLDKEPGYALNIDLCHRIDHGRVLKDKKYEEIIKDAFLTIKNEIIAKTPGRKVELSGSFCLSVSTALGVVFSPLATCHTALKPKDSDDLWHIKIPPESTAFKVTTTTQSVSGTDYALLVSVTKNAVYDFNQIAKDLPLRAIVNVAPEEFQSGKYSALNAAQAVDIAKRAVDGLFQAMDDYRASQKGTVHLFIAGPVGLAFLIGQQLNTLSSVQTYEYINSEDCIYLPSLLLHPNK
ncbi:MAG: SAVED domain-containing protein [Reinekea sp.]